MINNDLNEKELTLLQKNLLTEVSKLNRENQNHVLSFAKSLSSKKLEKVIVSLASS